MRLRRYEYLPRSRLLICLPPKERASGKEHQESVFASYGEDMSEIRNWKWSQGETQKGKPLAEKTRVPESS